MKALKGIGPRAEFIFKPDRFHIVATATKAVSDAKKAKKRKKNTEQLAQVFCTFLIDDVKYKFVGEEPFAVSVELESFITYAKVDKKDPLVLSVFENGDNVKFFVETKTGGLRLVSSSKIEGTTKYIDYLAKYFTNVSPVAKVLSRDIESIFVIANNSSICFDWHTKSGKVEARVGSTLECLSESVRIAEGKEKKITKTIDFKTNKWLKGTSKLTSGVFQLFISQEKATPVVMRIHIGNQGHAVISIPPQRNENGDEDED